MTSRHVCLGAALVALSIAGSAQAAVVSATGAASYSTTVETTGPFGTTSFQAAGNAANTNTPADRFPAFGVVAFNSSSFSSLATATASATLTASEFISTSTSTGTQPGTVNIYFAEAPQTGTGLGTYDANNTPGGFDAGNFNADLVGVATYSNAANQVDTIPLTFSMADVNYINSVLAGGSGTFELFTVAATSTTSVRYDGNYAPAPATLTLNGTAAVPEPTTLGLAAVAGLGLAARRRRA